MWDLKRIRRWINTRTPREQKELLQHMLDTKPAKLALARALWSQKYPERKEDTIASITSDPSTTEQGVQSGELASSLQSSESKEVVEKSLEFAEDTFKIDSRDWPEVTREAVKDNPLLEKFLECRHRVTANITGDVMEYFAWLHKWEQLFIHDYRVVSEREKLLSYIAAAKWSSIEEVEKRYFLTEEELLEKMKDKPSESEAYKLWAEKNIPQEQRAGNWFIGNEDCHNVGKVSFILLAGGNYAWFSEDQRKIFNTWDLMRWSVRLLKDPKPVLPKGKNQDSHFVV